MRIEHETGLSSPRVEMLAIVLAGLLAASAGLGMSWYFDAEALIASLLAISVFLFSLAAYLALRLTHAVSQLGIRVTVLEDELAALRHEPLFNSELLDAHAELDDQVEALRGLRDALTNADEAVAAEPRNGPIAPVTIDTPKATRTKAMRHEAVQGQATARVVVRPVQTSAEKNPTTQGLGAGTASSTGVKQVSQSLREQASQAKTPAARSTSGPDAPAVGRAGDNRPTAKSAATTEELIEAALRMGQFNILSHPVLSVDGGNVHANLLRCSLPESWPDKAGAPSDELIREVADLTGLRAGLDLAMIAGSAQQLRMPAAQRDAQVYCSIALRSLRDRNFFRSVTDAMKSHRELVKRIVLVLGSADLAALTESDYEALGAFERLGFRIGVQLSSATAVKPDRFARAHIDVALVGADMVLAMQDQQRRALATVCKGLRIAAVVTAIRDERGLAAAIEAGFVYAEGGVIAGAKSMAAPRAA